MLLGGQGDDVFFGGDGDDVIRGGDGKDSIDGEAGDDLLFGEESADAPSAATVTTNATAAPETAIRRTADVRSCSISPKTGAFVVGKG